jgi:hypothetical protein
MQAPPASGSKLRTVASVGADGALRDPGADDAWAHVACPFAPGADWDRSIDDSIVVVDILRWPSSVYMFIFGVYSVYIAAHTMDVQI